VEVVSRFIPGDDAPIGNEGKDDGGIPWLGIILTIVVVVSLLAGAIALAIYHRKRNSPEITLGMEREPSESEGDDETTS
jgi:hypothetical protein